MRIYAEDPQSNTDSTTALKKPFFICSGRVDFQIVCNRSRALQAFDILMRTSFSVEAMLLPSFTQSFYWTVLIVAHIFSFGCIDM